MKVLWGTNRIVFLFGDHAYKVARFRPIRPWIRLFQLLRVGRVGTQLKTYDTNIGRGVIKYLCTGVIANRVEYQFSHDYPDAPISHVVAIYLGGLIAVQRRGDIVSLADSAVKEHPLWLAMVEEAGSEVGACRQFARFLERVLIVDYGRPELRPYFG